MGLLKWLGMHEHEWSPWETVERGNIVIGLPPLAQMFTKDPHWHVAGEFKKQKRKCKTCGLSQTRAEKVYY
jgi:hypothetical protein